MSNTVYLLILVLFSVFEVSAADDIGTQDISFKLNNFRYVFIGVSKDLESKIFIPIDTQEYESGSPVRVVEGFISVNSKDKSLRFRSIDQNDPEQRIEVKVDLSESYLGITNSDDQTFSVESFIVESEENCVKISFRVTSVEGQALVCFVFGRTAKTMKEQISVDPSLKLWKWNFRKISFG